MRGARWPVLVPTVALIMLAWPADSRARAAEPATPPPFLAAAVPGEQSAVVLLADGMRGLNGYTALAQTALTQNNLLAARAAYAQFDLGWGLVENGVRERSRSDYRSIEDAMSEVDRILRNDPVDVAIASMLLGALQTRVDRFIATLPTS
jgi:hypothetical protein